MQRLFKYWVKCQCWGKENQPVGEQILDPQMLKLVLPVRRYMHSNRRWTIAANLIVRICNVSFSEVYQCISSSDEVKQNIEYWLIIII